MKKFLLSSSVIVIFLAYSLHQKEEADQARVVPPSPTQPVSQQATPTTGSSAPITPIPTIKQTGQYKDGSYTGSVADAYYGNIQVKAIISGGKIVDVQFLQYPNDRGTSIEINSQAMPFLKQEAIAAQSANVDTVSGASDSSMAFRQSLADALSQAKL